MELVVATGSRLNPMVPDRAKPLPAVITTLIELAADPDPDTRGSALHVLADSYLDTAQVHAILTDHLSDPSPQARIRSAVGLTFRDDVRGREAFRALQADPATADLARKQLAELDRFLARRPPPHQH
jgi:HEAT repeat protein